MALTGAMKSKNKNTNNPLAELSFVRLTIGPPEIGFTLAG